MAGTRRTEIIHPHGMVVCLWCEFLAGVLLRLNNEWIIGWEFDVLDEQRLGLVDVFLAA